MSTNTEAAAASDSLWVLCLEPGLARPLAQAAAVLGWQCHRLPALGSKLLRGPKVTRRCLCLLCEGGLCTLSSDQDNDRLLRRSQASWVAIIYLLLQLRCPLCCDAGAWISPSLPLGDFLWLNPPEIPVGKAGQVFEVCVLPGFLSCSGFTVQPTTVVECRVTCWHPHPPPPTPPCLEPLSVCSRAQT